MAAILTLALQLDNARTELDNANRALSEYRTAAQKAALARFVQAGGCPNCKGFGGFSTSYHDGDSVWDDCSRIRQGTCSKGKLPPFQWTGIDGDDIEGMRLEDAAYLATNEVRRLERALTPDKGKLVKVFKGRKVPIGTTGRIFWIGDGTYGERVGIKDDKGETHWTASSNIEVIEDVPADTTPATDRPDKGRRIRHDGKEGVVFWYGRGRDGLSFRVGYNPVQGRKTSKEAVWVDAKDVEVIAA